MNRSEKDFRKAIENREFPVCPPVHEILGGHKRVSIDVSYIDRWGGRHKTIKVFNHSAPFAVTRWTNLHFDTSLHKDPIGGQVSPQFGPWVKDVPLDDPPEHHKFLHTKYWYGETSDQHIKALQAALALDSGQQLRKDLSKHSPLMYLPREL